ncbi:MULTISPECIES: glutamate--tRNA ligase [unclassified Arenibacter]|uniref:glutamate--tRNA ligase n=1 Tax=unclassified Arenibacter TaxID=2615047 RepID=UPI000E344B57|nr:MULTISPECIES: glutamate--tRNA ligase [unclassified Arenibacter]MCM4165919.1 glutamate--tRNA ligase [Arenibacter sp. A80]RFT54429.1 glutamate--tRNA ligase [Arenibacter sp. P308M17]
MTKKVRVRFAPSPTGPLHIGGVRTALFNYLFAKKHQGDFILRIEDTDQNRYVEGAEQYMIDALNWCNIPYDEGPGKDGGYGPYRQSDRKELYKKYADTLIYKGHAYYAFDTSENLDFHRKDHEEKGKTFIYNHHNRLKLSNSLSLTPEETNAKLQAGQEFVIRFKTPQNTELHLTDIIRGEIKIDTNTLDDKVLFKSDGMPTYHLANIVDDHLMDITHVIRGEEWLPSLALHQQLYDAFGWESPKFAHLPLIMKPVGKGKLSKRDGEKMGFPVFPFTWKESIGYREAGYFPEAVINFLALLGWNPGTEQEIFSLEELVAAFSLERVNKSGARFDPDKTKWYNQHYMQTRDNTELANSFLQILTAKGVDLPKDRDNAHYVIQVVRLIKERATFVNDFWELGNYFFIAPTAYDEKAVKKQWKEDSPSIMGKIAAFLEGTEDFASENLETQVKQWISENGLSFGKVMPPLRLVIVGEMKGPHIFDIMSLIGRKDCINRIKTAIAAL